MKIPGAEIYISDVNMRDKQNSPVLLGFLQLINNNKMNPKNHLDASIFLIEMLVIKIRALD